MAEAAKSPTPRRARLVAAALATGVVLVGCFAFRVYPTEVDSLSDLKSDEVLLVGRFEFIPPIGPEEQAIEDVPTIGTSAGEAWGRRILVYPTATPEVIEAADWSGKTLINPPLEAPYFMAWPADRPYIARAEVVMLWWSHARLNRRSPVYSREVIELPAPITVDIRPDDSAIYTGTVRVYRNAASRPSCIEVVDEYEEALEMVHQRFSPTFKLRRAPLVFPANSRLVADRCSDGPRTGSPERRSPDDEPGDRLEEDFDDK